MNLKYLNDIISEEIGNPQLRLGQRIGNYLNRSILIPAALAFGVLHYVDNLPEIKLQDDQRYCQSRLESIGPRSNFDCYSIINDYEITLESMRRK